MGGSSVNVMWVLRPMKADLDIWVKLGNPDWSYEKCLPVMKRIESDQDFPDSAIHGNSGPLYVKRHFTLDMEVSPPARAFIDSALLMGLPKCPDLYVPEPYGVCSSPYNIKDGKMDFAIDQQQYIQGYLPIVMLTQYAQTKNLMTGNGQGLIMTGPGFVTADNAADVISLAAAGLR
jgi:hypothetical protein